MVLVHGMGHEKTLDRPLELQYIKISSTMKHFEV